MSKAEEYKVFQSKMRVWERIKDGWRGENDHNIVRKGGRRPPNPPGPPPTSEFPPDPPRLSGI